MGCGLWSQAELGLRPGSFIHQLCDPKRAGSLRTQFLLNDSLQVSTNLLISTLRASAPHPPDEVVIILPCFSAFSALGSHEKSTKCLSEIKLGHACGPFLKWQSNNLTGKEHKPEQGQQLFQGHAWRNAMWKKFIFSLPFPLSCLLFLTPSPLFQSVEFPFMSFK